MVVPTTESDVLEIVALLTGRLVSPELVDDDRAEQFARASAIYLLWPYARAFFQDMARMAGVTAPPLPLIYRRLPGGAINLRPGRAE